MLRSERRVGLQISLTFSHDFKVEVLWDDFVEATSKLCKPVGMSICWPVQMGSEDRDARDERERVSHKPFIGPKRRNKTNPARERVTLS